MRRSGSQAGWGGAARSGRGEEAEEGEPRDLVGCVLEDWDCEGGARGGGGRIRLWPLGLGDRTRLMLVERSFARGDFSLRSRSRSEWKGFERNQPGWLGRERAVVVDIFRRELL